MNTSFIKTQEISISKPVVSIFIGDTIQEDKVYVLFFFPNKFYRWVCITKDYFHVQVDLNLDHFKSIFNGIDSLKVSIVDEKANELDKKIIPLNKNKIINTYSNQGIYNKITVV